MLRVTIEEDVEFAAEGLDPGSREFVICEALVRQAGMAYLDTTSPGTAAEVAVEALRAAGYRIVHPETMREDCPDPWTCCIHEPPKDP